MNKLSAEERETSLTVNKMEETKTVRYRINISRGMKGNASYEATVDMIGFEMDDVLNHSDALVAELNKRYPAPIKED